MVNTDPAEETKRNIDIDGEEVLEVETTGVSLLATRTGGIGDVTIGPNGEWTLNYNTTDSQLELIDSAGSIVAIFEDDGNTLDFRRVPLAPEYDSVSDAPQNPRGIVRFTSETTKTPGLYSYSEAESEWIQLDSV